MHRRNLLSGLGAAPYAFVLVLAGCGGGGYGGGMSSPYSGAPTQMPAPNVMFGSPAQATTNHFAQAVKLPGRHERDLLAASASSHIGGALAGLVHQRVSYRCAGRDRHGYLHAVLHGTRRHDVGTDQRCHCASVHSQHAVTEHHYHHRLHGRPDRAWGQPYGLAIAPVTAGLVTAGDLIACNFNDGATNTQGLGTTIVGLHPSPAQAVSNRSILVAAGMQRAHHFRRRRQRRRAYCANQNPLVAPSGTAGTPFSTDTFAQPWGEAYVAANGQNPAALYVSNANGTIDRITLSGDTQTAFTEIIQGFCGSGQPGAIYAPAGLTYDPSVDTLYVIDTSSTVS